MQMRAARIHRFNQPLEIHEVPVPDVGPNQVLLKVAAAGMCRSDAHLEALGRGDIVGRAVIVFD